MLRCVVFFFFKQKTAYEMTCDWSSDVCSSDLSDDRKTDLATDVVDDLRAADHQRHPSPGRSSGRRWLSDARSSRCGHRRVRSEERRVGKEWRIGGDRCHSNKKNDPNRGATSPI